MRIACVGHLGDLVLDGLLFTHRTNDGDEYLLALFVIFLNRFSNVTLRNFDIALEGAIRSHQVHETITLNVDKLVFIAADVGNVHVVGGGRDIFQLFAGENVNSNKVNLGVTMLSSLGSGHINDFARAAFDNNVSVFPKCRALHGEGQRGPSTGLLEGLVVLLVIGHFEGELLDKKQK